MFNTVKRLCTALECLTSATEALRESVVVARDWHAEHGNVEARVEQLEREKHLFMAEVHGELLKAQAEYRKAGNAEKRAQNARDSNDPFGDGGDVESPAVIAAYNEWARANLDPESENGPVQAVPEVVAASSSVVDSLRAAKRRR